MTIPIIPIIPIKLSEIFDIKKEFKKYHMHFASEYKEGGASAYDTFLDHYDSWMICWNTNRGHQKAKRRAFTRPFVISFIRMSEQEWLFAGIIDRDSKNGEAKPKQLKLYESLTGRLVVIYNKDSRRTYRYATQALLDFIEVKEIKIQRVRKEERDII